MSRIDYIHSKIVSVEQAARLATTWKLKNEEIVFTNGCFDILHKGHVTYLAKAADLGNRLIVALNTDASVKAQNKSPERPINNESARLQVLASLGFVDLVVLFDEKTPEEIIKQIKPTVLVKGADYDENETEPTSKKYIVGSDFVKSVGGTVKTIDLEAGYSTTNIISKIKV
jgi:rfaE bifunctional protein nucleotidyltransferase chain/domain